MTGPTDSGWAELGDSLQRQKMELDEVRSRMIRYEELLAANTLATTASAKAVAESRVILDEITEWGAEMREWLTACRKGLQVLGWLGAAAKWVVGIAAACGVAYETYRRLKG